MYNEIDSNKKNNRDLLHQVILPFFFFVAIPHAEKTKQLSHPNPNNKPILTIQGSLSLSTTSITLAKSNYIYTLTRFLLMGKMHAEAIHTITNQLQKNKQHKI